MRKEMCKSENKTIRGQKRDSPAPTILRAGLAFQGSPPLLEPLPCSPGLGTLAGLRETAETIQAKIHKYSKHISSPGYTLPKNTRKGFH